MSMAEFTKDERATRAYAWRVLSVTSLGSTLSALNISTLNVALPVVARHFHAGGTAASWLLLGYMIVTTVMMLSFGRLADIVGRRGLYIAGIAGLTLTSLACGLAPNMAALQTFRILQAITAAALITNTTAILTDAFPRSILPVGLSVQMTLVASAQVAGPALGGLLAQHLGWRAVFWFNVPGGVLGTCWALVTLRRLPKRSSGERFDVTSSFLSLLIIGGLVTALSQGTQVGLAHPLVLGSLAVFVVALPLFVARQRRAVSPLLDLTLFDNWARVAAYVCNLTLAIVRLGVVLLVGLYLQGTGARSTGETGLIASSVAVGIVLTSPVAGRLVTRFPPQLVCTSGVVLQAVSLTVLAVHLEPSTAPSTLVVLLFLIGVGVGLFMTPNTTSIMTSVPPQRRGIANAIRSTCQNTGYAVSTALVLGLATFPLASGERDLAYQGGLGRLQPSAVGDFTSAVHIAFWVLTALALFSAFMSYSRGNARIPDYDAGAFSTSEE
jgi:EmrB/QacA subfamily drug resistance transporter